MISAAELFADLNRKPRFRAEYARLAREYQAAARRIKRTQKSPRGAGLFGMIGASTEVLGTTTAGDFTHVAISEQTKMHTYSGTPARVCHPVPARPSYPDPSAVRAFVRFIGDLQHANGGQPVILHPNEIARATGIPESDQISIRQFLMLADRLHLSVVGNAWTYSLEARP